MCVGVCWGGRGGGGREQGVLCVRERVKVLVQKKKKKKARETLISWKLNLSRNNRQITRF